MLGRVETVAKTLAMSATGMFLGTYIVEAILTPQDTDTLETMHVSHLGETFMTASTLGGLTAGGIFLGVRAYRNHRSNSTLQSVSNS